AVQPDISIVAGFDRCLSTTSDRQWDLRVTNALGQVHALHLLAFDAHDADLRWDDPAGVPVQGNHPVILCLLRTKAQPTASPGHLYGAFTIEARSYPMDPKLLARTAEHAQKYLDSLPVRPVKESASREELVAMLGGPIPENGENELATIDLLAQAAEVGT